MFIGEDDTFVNMLKKYSTTIYSTENRVVSKRYASYVKKLFERNNIKNDIDLLRYFEDHYDDKVSFFMSYKKQKETFVMRTFADIMLPSLASINLIDGEYEGYVLNMSSNVIKELAILKNNKRYFFTFIGDYEDSYIHDLMNTVIIE